MRRGFTVLELIVASFLLGALVTIVTMVINQSSVVWRVGIAGVAQMDDARDNIAELHEESDNVYIWDGAPYRILSLWQRDGKLRIRAIDADDVKVERYEKATFLAAKGGLKDGMTIDEIPQVGVGSSNTPGYKNYVVNVISLGPSVDDDWDDIKSFPDDYEL